MENINNYIQERFIKKVEDSLVRIYLVTGYSFDAKIIGSDNFCLLVNPVNKGLLEIKNCLIFKSSITSIEIAQDLKLNTVFNTEKKINNTPLKPNIQKPKPVITNHFLNDSEKKPLVDQNKKNNLSIKDIEIPRKSQLPTIKSTEIKFDSSPKIDNNTIKEYSIDEFQNELLKK